MNDITNRSRKIELQQKAGIDRPELPWDDSTGDHIRILDNVFGSRSSSLTDQGGLITG